MSNNVAFDMFVPANLLAGIGVPVTPQSAVIQGGQGVLKLGTVLGRITIDPPVAEPDEGNTGEGTCTMDGAAPLLRGFQTGIYTLTCLTIKAGEVESTWSVEDPQENNIGTATAGTAFTKQLKFVIAEDLEGVPFAADDVFTIEVEAGKYKMVDADAIDGSDTARLVLPADIDTGLAELAEDVTIDCIQSGELNRLALIVADGDTVEGFEEDLEAMGIYLKDNVPA